MNNKQLKLNRRNFLCGTGVALALPWMETFAAENASAKNTPRRFMSVYHPDGVGLPLKKDPAWKDWSWFPYGSEKDFKLTKVLDVLEPLGVQPSIYSSQHSQQYFPYRRKGTREYKDNDGLGGVEPPRPE